MTVHQHLVTFLDIHINLLNDHKNLVVGCDSVVFPVVVVIRDSSVVEFIRVVTEPYFVGD